MDCASSNRQDDFAEMLVGLHVLERGRRLIERKFLIDRQAQFAVIDELPKIFPHPPRDLAHFLEAARAERDADIIDAFEGMEIVVEVAGLAAEPPNIDDAPEDARSMHVAVHDAAET